MKQHGNGRHRNGASRDRTLLEIMDRLAELSRSEKQDVLEFVQSWKKEPDES